MNQAGQVAGSSQRLDPIGSPLEGFGRSAWLYDPALNTTLRIGLLDAEHTSDDGVQSSSARALTNNGRVVGSSERYGGTTDLGFTAWIFDSATNQTTTLGFTGPGFVSSAGVMQSTASFVNGFGQVAGTSKKYVVPGSTPGQAAWLFDGAAATRIGLIDAPYTDAAGRQNAEVRAINTAGRVLGISTRYSATGANLGSAAWLHSGGATTRIGLFDAEHTSQAGVQSSGSRILNEAGQVLGSSTRYFPVGTAGSAGTSVWYYDGTITRRVNPDRSDLIAANGARVASALALNQLGQGIGYSQTYAPGTNNVTGTIGWYFDGALGQSAILEINDGVSVRPARARLISDTGLVAGTFSVDRLDPNDSGSRVFLWSAGAGFIDIDRLVPGGLAAAGWAWLSSVTQISPEGTTLVGMGRPIDWQTDSAVFVLTIPAPWSGAMVIGGAIWATGRRRRTLSVRSSPRSPPLRTPPAPASPCSSRSPGPRSRG